ncbi:hypothetical protein AVEN_259118-1 [Araneus ventricosus]|uniref:Uncharacterized protein n=1 Tax=Araneus ventricosus TaxID=182803 RepID=A0A4Y2LAE5_ARAVE|nr:hypothetical protein AVEN_259118-1 [Araneus ventricosus]
MCGINVEEYDLMVFEKVTEKEKPFRLRLLSEITDEMESDNEEDADDDTDNKAIFLDIPLLTSIRDGPNGGDRAPCRRCCASPSGKTFVPRSHNGVFN